MIACAALVAGLAQTSSAKASAPHVVAPGETLWSISAANNLTTRTVAVFNGLSEDSQVVEGQTIQVPTVEEGAAALAGAGITPGAPSGADPAASSSTAGMGHIPSPSGELHLEAAAADSWNAMREDSLSNYGVDLYPTGSAAAYRTTEQQQQLYDLYLSGQGAPANPPGTSSHETGTAVDVAEPVMRDVIDQIGSAYGWVATIPSEWWHVQHNP